MVGSGGSTQSTSFHNAQGMTINGNNNHTTATAAASSSSSSTSTLNPKSNSNSTLPSTSSSQPRPPQDQHSQPNHNNNNNPHSQRDWAVLEVLSAARISKQQEWVKLMHLSRLASQHHLSPYSVMKYGELGEWRREQQGSQGQTEPEGSGSIEWQSMEEPRTHPTR